MIAPRSSEPRTGGSLGPGSPPRRRPTAVGRLATALVTTVIAVGGLGAQTSPPQQGGATPITLTATQAATSAVAQANARRVEDPQVAPTRTMSDAIDRAIRTYRGTGVAQPVVVGPVTAHPFGHSTPTLTCTPLRACTIQLEAGETLVHEPIAGDVERWRIARAGAGPDGRSSIVVVKPTDCAITTNVVLSTDRRIYDLTLDSPPCREGTTNPAGQGGRQVRFYYPDDTLRPEPSAEAVDTVGIRIVELNRNYRLPRKPKFPWTPAEVFDDGAHVYIRIPESARHQAAPVLYALEEDGSRTLLNYTVRGDMYVTDRTFRRGLLVLGSGRTEQTLELENQAWGAERLPAPPARGASPPDGR